MTKIRDRSPTKLTRTPSGKRSKTPSIPLKKGIMKIYTHAGAEASFRAKIPISGLIQQNGTLDKDLDKDYISYAMWKTGLRQKGFFLFDETEDDDLLDEEDVRGFMKWGSLIVRAEIDFRKMLEQMEEALAEDGKAELKVLFLEVAMPAAVAGL